MSTDQKGIDESAAAALGQHGLAQFGTRVGRVLRLDPRPFDAIEADARALPQALCVVLLAGLARGIFGATTQVGPGVVGSLAGAVVLWLVATALLTEVGGHWLHGTTDFREMLRTLGFAAAPLWLVAPAAWLAAPLQTPVAVFVHLWAIAAGVVAVRQALDVGTGRALAACGLSLLLAVGLILLLGCA